MDDLQLERQSPPQSLAETTSVANDVVTLEPQFRPVKWPERIGWMAFGLLVLALWIAIGAWMWRVIAA